MQCALPPRQLRPLQRLTHLQFHQHQLYPQHLTPLNELLLRLFLGDENGELEKEGPRFGSLKPRRIRGRWGQELGRVLRGDPAATVIPSGRMQPDTYN